MEPDKDVVWSGRPWIGPSLAVRTIGVIVAGLLIFAIFSTIGILAFPIVAVPLFVWVTGALALAWLALIGPLLVMRASFNYLLRPSSIEIDEGIVRKRVLLVSPSAFSELEIDQGIIGRMLNYGNLEVRSQGAQQLNFMLIRNPKAVSVRIRDVMTIPTVRIAKEQAVVMPAGKA